MKNLLNTQENRRLNFVETLTNQKDWSTLTELAALLDCSTRILKYDIQSLNEHHDDFQIQTSNSGIRIIYLPNKDFKSFCQKALAQAEAYQLLETIFLSQGITVQELTEKLDISLSTFYRLIDQVNDRLIEAYDFWIETGPSRIAGNEENIRYFFYTYFFEKYEHSGWPFQKLEEKSVDFVIKTFIRTRNISSDFIHFNGLKVILLVNYIRYQNQAFVNVEPTEKDLKLQSQANFLRESIRKIAAKHEVACPNLETLVFALVNTAHLEYKGPQSGYILYDRHGYFAKDIQTEFPSFHEDLFDEMKQFRAKMNKPLTEDGINFYIYIVFSW